MDGVAELPFILKAVILFLSAAAAGLINSVAGGGTLVSFPALVLVGVPTINANATSTVALLPGSISSLWAYRHQFAAQKSWAWRLGLPSLIGGLIGAVLLLQTGEARFRELVPYLIFFAALLFTFQPRVSRWLRLEAQQLQQTRNGLVFAIFFQFCVAIYGGYFGAGIGILMLAALGVLGQTNIHEMNSLKVLLALLINSTAAAYFIASGTVLWFDGLLMAGGALFGGYTGAQLALRLGPRVVRAFVSIVGFGAGFYFLLR